MKGCDWSAHVRQPRARTRTLHARTMNEYQSKPKPSSLPSFAALRYCDNVAMMQHDPETRRPARRPCRPHGGRWLDHARLPPNLNG